MITHPERGFREMADVFEAFTSIVDRLQYDDVTANQQRALRTARAAIERAHIACRDVEKAFGGPGKPLGANARLCPFCRTLGPCEHR